MKNFITVIFLAAIIKAGYSQNTFPSTGNVGIGVSSPAALLQLGDIYSAGGMNLMVGDDTYLSDVDVANTLGLYGVQNGDRASLKLGSSGPTLFGINGSLNLGTTVAKTQAILQVYEGGSSTNTWRGRIVSSGDASAVVIGEFNSVACVGAHNVGLSTWNNLSIQHGGGNLGIGTTTPTQKVEINGGVLQNAENISFGIDSQSNARIGFIKKSGFSPMLASDNGNPIIFAQTNQTGIHTNISGATLTERMRIDGSGNVGIGTASPTQKLTVNGTIYGKELKLDLNVPGPDYVFEEDYALPSLESIQTYIDQNKHLPEIPSARDMETNGINLSEMNMLLLKKVEELTLYMIEQQKQINALKEKVNKN